MSANVKYMGKHEHEWVGRDTYCASWDLDVLSECSASEDGQCGGGEGG